MRTKPAEPISNKNYKEYLDFYGEPLSPEEELEIDNEVLRATIEALPKEAGFTYEELGEQATNATERTEELDERVSAYTRIFSKKLIRLHQERELAYGHFFIGPYSLVGRDQPRLYRLKDFANTPPDVLRFFHLKPRENFSDQPEAQASDMELLKAEHPQHIWAFSMMPIQTIDRAARGSQGWTLPHNDAPVASSCSQNRLFREYRLYKANFEAAFCRLQAER